MFDKNMIRPKSNNTITTTPLNSFTHKTTTTATRSIWVIVQLCFVVIQILASLVSPVNCDKPITTSTSSLTSPSSSLTSPSSSSGVQFIRSHNGDKLLHRVTRLTKLDHSNSSNSANHERLTNSANYMASYGLRTRFQPQKFYSKKERTSAVGAAAKGNLVSLNLISEPPKDICNGFCNCERKNAFITVTCDYQKNPMVS